MAHPFGEFAKGGDRGVAGLRRDVRTLMARGPGTHWRAHRQRPSRSSLVMHSTRLSSVCVSSLPAMFVLGD
eukprot:5322060-Prymnesium_polylepis.2